MSRFGIRIRIAAKAKKIWYRYWSVRLAILSSLCSAIELGMSYHATGQAPVFVIAALAVSLVGAWARIVKQDGLEDDYAQAP